jgi:hypothetical protein
MADCMPRDVPYNMLQERILGSDHSSAFPVGHAEVGYQLLGVNYYSTTRPAVSFVEIVKLTVELIQQLTTHLKLDLAASGVAIHYPNIFPDTWRMVTAVPPNTRRRTCSRWNVRSCALHGYRLSDFTGKISSGG